MHRLLTRQLKKSISRDGTLNLKKMCELVDRAYVDVDTNQLRSDRANTLMSEELEALNLDLNTAVEQMQIKNSWFEAAINNTPQGLCLFDKNQRLLVSNEAYATIYSLEPTDILTGMPMDEILQLRVDKGVFVGDTPKEYLSDYYHSTNSDQRSLRQHTLSTGQEIEILHQPLETGGYLSIHNDITERCKAEKQIKDMAQSDALTGLPNRAKIHDVLPDAVEHSLESGEKIAIFYIDLDGFKEINDTLGHPIGDHVLKEVANRLKASGDSRLFAGRLSGDEFLVIVNDVKSTEELQELGDEICTALARPIETSHGFVSVSASIGISVGPLPQGSVETLIQYADLALYKAKADGANRCVFFEEGMFEASIERRRLASELASAIANDELVLHYQPQINMNSGDIIGYEALLRWNHPEIGLIPPLKFISIAEETGQIGKLGEWVLRTACKYAASWPLELKISVNISPVQFKRQNVVKVVQAALKESGLDPKRLELEITESVMIEKTNSVVGVLQQLNKMGVSIALDDFGTGFSSLSYLTKIPFQQIKIDKTFVDDIGTKTEITAIVGLILGLGRSLDVTITAEGIETSDQHDLLKAAGCNQGQGYLYGRPMPMILEETSLHVEKQVG